jgi:hypothetical protein
MKNGGSESGGEAWLLSMTLQFPSELGAHSVISSRSAGLGSSQAPHVRIVAEFSRVPNQSKSPGRSQGLTKRAKTPRKTYTGDIANFHGHFRPHLHLLA